MGVQGTTTQCCAMFVLFRGSLCYEQRTVRSLTDRAATATNNRRITSFACAARVQTRTLQHTKNNALFVVTHYGADPDIYANLKYSAVYIINIK